MPDHGLGSFTRAQWWGIITTEVNLQKSKRSVDHPRNKPRMSFRGISDATTILYPFGAENRAKSSLLKPTTVVAGTTISAVKKKCAAQVLDAPAQQENTTENFPSVIVSVKVSTPLTMSQNQMVLLSSQVGVN
jgi:hypothetical protein